MTAPISTSERVSVEEFLAGDWPADAWLVDGEVVMNDPGFHHQEVVARLVEALRAWCRAGPDRGRAGFGGNWIIGPYTLLKPDVWWCTVPPTGKYRETPPELVVEVRSDSTWRYDIGRKREIYKEAGVAELWLVDPEAEAVLVWRRTAEGNGFDPVAVPEAGDTLTSPLLDGFALSIDDLFAGSG